MKNKKISYNLISEYRGFLMGLSIIMIILFHFVSDCKSYHYNFDGIWYNFNYYFSSSAVDIFLILSGFGLYFSFKKNSDKKTFFKRHLTKVIVPYLIIGIPALIGKEVLVSEFQIRRFLERLFFVEDIKTKSSWCWYILAIIICYLIFPAIYQLFADSKDTSSDVIRLLVLLSVLYILNLGIQINVPKLYDNTNMILLRLPMFVFGVFLGKQATEKRQFSWIWIIILIVSSKLLFYAMRLGGGIVFNRNARAVLCMTVLLILIVLIDKLPFKKYIKKPFEFVGRYTLELYLSHVVVRWYMKHLGYQTCRYRYEIIMILISIVLTIVLRLLSKLVFKIAKIS